MYSHKKIMYYSGHVIVTRLLLFVHRFQCGRSWSFDRPKLHLERFTKVKFCLDRLADTENISWPLDHFLTLVLAVTHGSEHPLIVLVVERPFDLFQNMRSQKCYQRIWSCIWGHYFNVPLWSWSFKTLYIRHKLTWSDCWVSSYVVDTIGPLPAVRKQIILSTQTKLRLPVAGMV